MLQVDTLFKFRILVLLYLILIAFIVYRHCPKTQLLKP